MKSGLIFALAMLFQVSAYAGGISELSCKLKSNPNDVFTFQISELGSDEADFVHADPDDEYSQIFHTQSENRDISSMIGSLEGQGGDLRVRANSIEMIGDAAGIDFTNLVLYKNSGFTKGYLRYDYAGELGYTKVSCEVKAVVP
jgi:hypothetical protein